MSDRKIATSANNLVCVCINKIGDGEYKGILYNKYQKEGLEFEQLDQLIMPIEELLDELQTPRAAQKSRSFEKDSKAKARLNIDKNEKVWNDEEFMNISGAIATFYILVKYRQSSTWQGEIFWKEQNVKAEFLSELDMLKIIDSAADYI